jgi:hypothetical protein
MFKLYEYLQSIKSGLTATDDVYKASGISKMEELLGNLRNSPKCVAVARDSGDGYLNFKDRRLDTGYHLFYLLVRAKLNDHTAVLDAKREAMSAGIEVLERMKRDSINFGDPAYGIDFSRVDYSEIGPIAGYFGYSFSFLVEQSFKWPTTSISS